MHLKCALFVTRQDRNPICKNCIWQDKACLREYISACAVGRLLELSSSVGVHEMNFKSHATQICFHCFLAVANPDNKASAAELDDDDDVPELVGNFDEASKDD